MPLALCCMSHSPLLNLPGPSAELLDDINARLVETRDFVAAFDPRARGHLLPRTTTTGSSTA